MRRSGSLRVATIVVSLLVAAFGPAKGQDPNTCDEPGDAPDLVLSVITDVHRWGDVEGITAFSLGVEACNLGTCEVLWDGASAAHPILGQNMFRLRDGRFEQIGQSWVKHGFGAAQEDGCASGSCIPSAEHLGVNCSDPYFSSINGSQTFMSHKSEVDASTGTFTFPPTAQGVTGDEVFKRLQVRSTDLDPALHPGAQYFVEGQYLSADDAAAGTLANNASWREITVFGSAGQFDADVTGATFAERAALEAWAVQDFSVLLVHVDVPGDGRFVVASKATDLGGGLWHYEYAVQNLTSHRSGGSFRVPVPFLAGVGNPGFHDVDYHSGEIYDGTEWIFSVDTVSSPNTATWATATFTEDPDANALRWGTLYNFRFDVDRPPAQGNVSLGLFRPGAPAEIKARMWVPDPCDLDGRCEPGETCGNCAVDCLDQGGLGGCCGDDVCDPGEDACTCAADCAGPCEQACTDPAPCDDGSFCNGAEVCTGQICAPGADPCPGQLCDEFLDLCVDCFEDADCDDATFCNGAESCAAGACVAGADACPGQLCDEPGQACFGCTADSFCDDGAFCSGVETCSDAVCTAGTEPCPDSPCDEALDRCAECIDDTPCDDGLFCNGAEACVDGACTAGEHPCPGRICDEPAQLCLGNVDPQPRLGEPLLRLTAAQKQRFEAGRTVFESLFDAAGGLGPTFNGTGCTSCHVPLSGGAGTTTVTHFGFVDAALGGAFDPLTELGGTMLQSQATSPACLETVPPEANVTAARIPSTLAGSGLVEAILDLFIDFQSQNPPAGISGRSHFVEPLESPGTPRVGRFGWKAQEATALSFVARELRDQIGVTNRLLPLENAPNGDAALLEQCDTVADPEDGPDTGGQDRIDRLNDYVRYLAPPPQTPRSGMDGEVPFVLSGCMDCHEQDFPTPNDPALEAAIRGRTVRAYSDFLLHDMGDAGDGIGHGDAARNEVRTAPLWGLRNRTALWHDGRFTGTFEERVLAAIAAHDAPHSEASSSAQAFFALPRVSRDAVIALLDSLGRAEFDHDGDHDVDADDYAVFASCFTGQGATYTPDDPCSISDVDQDGDVDDDDFALFLPAAEGAAGSVPDGAARPGPPLTLVRSGGTIVLDWGASCGVGDLDYAVYEGTLGDFDGHLPRTCSTGGSTSATIVAPAGDAYYLVVPTIGFREGSYGTDGAGAERPVSAQACLPRSFTACEVP